MIDKIKTFIKLRLEERTTLDGVVLILAGISYLIFKPLAVIVAYIAIGYGVYTLVKKEK
jgi:hypothetical protein